MEEDFGTMEKAEKPLVIARLNGGLGNQLFQYAAARRLAQRRGADLRFDLGAFAAGGERTYRLGFLRVRGEPAAAGEVAELTGGEGFKGTCRRLLGRARPRHGRPVFHERRFGRYDPDILRTPARVYLHGYWQCEAYFLEVAEALRREIAPRGELDPGSRETAARLEQPGSVSVHVRRGDYASDPEAQRVHGLCDPAYYRRCAQSLAERVGDPRYFVFSDDPDWARRHLNLGGPTEFVSHNGPERDYRDLHLMSLCRHHIIANSSFSWWGAWLSAGPGKLVFAPRKWFQAAEMDEGDLVPPSWIRM
jgi:hypothetical protein